VENFRFKISARRSTPRTGLRHRGDALVTVRSLGFGPGLGWLFRLAIVWVALGRAARLAFPGGIRRTGDMLVQRPAAVLLSALLTMLALPILFILLCITVIGIPVAILGLPIGIFVAVLFGQASIHGLLGRAVDAGTGFRCRSWCSSVDLS